MFRVPRIGNGKFCTRPITRIWIVVDEIGQESSRLSEIRLAQSLLGLLEQHDVRLISADFPPGHLGVSEAQQNAKKNKCDHTKNDCSPYHLASSAPKDVS